MPVAILRRPTDTSPRLAPVEPHYAPLFCLARDDRFARATVRVALRQLRASDPAASALAAWLSTHDRFDAAEPQDAAEAPH